MVPSMVKLKKKYSTKLNNEHKHPYSAFMAQLILISTKTPNSFKCKVIKFRITWSIKIYLPFLLYMQVLLYRSADCHWFNDCRTLGYFINTETKVTNNERAPLGLHRIYVFSWCDGSICLFVRCFVAFAQQRNFSI